MSVQQRFCPLCNRAFQENEAVLRCEGCGVMHHPGCWVTNGGCGTQSEHRTTPQAMAYSGGDRLSGAPAPHPGEGTRMAPLPGADEADPSEPIPLRPIQRTAEAAPGETVIGAASSPPPMIHRTLPSTVGTPAAPRRYQPPPGEQMPRKQMPKIYGGHPILRFWYVPVAALLAIFVAFSVIWASGKLFGGDDDPQQAQDPTPAPTGAGGAQTTPEPSPTAGGTTSASPTAGPSTGPGKFKGGDAVVVTGTDPDCLNVRVKAGRENDAIVCVKDGTVLRITGGPETASELTWWKVQTELGEGWAAEDYLQPQR